MALTDVQIYEKHPDIKALNDEYVALGKALPELANAVTLTGSLMADAEAAQRSAVQTATEAVQAAQKQLDSVKAQQALSVTKAKAAYDEAVSKATLATSRRAEVQQRHNAAIEAVQAVENSASEG